MSNIQDLLILTSPPATGKTYFIFEFQKKLSDEKILFISPLRALADECRNKWNSSIDVVTPEEWMVKKQTSRVVIFDEFHLYFYWGDTFRPIMWEVFHEISYFAELVIVLTATLSPTMKQELEQFSHHFDSILLADYGNQNLKFKPSTYIHAPSKAWILDVIKNEIKNDGVKLIFCQFRHEVLSMQIKLEKEGFKTISCIGGESKFMAQRLKAMPQPDFIIATTVLSHGVNLPEIKRIYFLYRLENLDFWIQMVARGGRKGESFEVVALEKPYVGHWSWFKNKLLVFIWNLKYRFFSSPLL